MGGGVFVGEDATFNMRDGGISGNISANAGGGVFVGGYGGGVFNMHDGKISDNIAANAGGGVFLDATFNMYVGTISGNTASSGGGVFVGVAGDNGEFIMRNGTISGNTAIATWASGGGVYVYGAFTMEGGTISGNTSTRRGGGVGVGDTGEFVMRNGEISGNYAVSETVWVQGGGVNILGAFVMYNGTILDNTASGYWAQGGGVLVDCYDNGFFVMRGGRISGNRAISNTAGWVNGAGVHVGNYSPGGGTFRMSGGIINGDNVGSHVDNTDGFYSTLTAGGTATAQYGRFENGTFIYSGDLIPTHLAVEVVDGVLQGLGSAIGFTLTAGNHLGVVAATEVPFTIGSEWR